MLEEDFELNVSKYVHSLCWLHTEVSELLPLVPRFCYFARATIVRQSCIEKHLYFDKSADVHSLCFTSYDLLYGIVSSENAELSGLLRISF